MDFDLRSHKPQLICHHDTVYKVKVDCPILSISHKVGGELKHFRWSALHIHISVSIHISDLHMNTYFSLNTEMPYLREIVPICNAISSIPKSSLIYLILI